MNAEPTPPPTSPGTIRTNAGRDRFRWSVIGLLAIIAAGVWLRSDTGFSPVFAQNQPALGARGVFAIAGQIDRNQYGLFMLDVDQGTVWCYGLENVGGTQRLRLVAARSWIYDRYLHDYNGVGLSFREVQQLVAQQRGQPGAEDAKPADGAPPPVRSGDGGGD